MILKADKGNQIVLLDKLTYLSQGERMLSDKNIYELLRKNPIQDEQALYNKEVSRIFAKMPAKHAPKRFLAYLPKLAYFYLRVKIHKNPIKYRPIVSQRQSMTTNLSKHLSNILTPCLGKFSSAHLHNTEELVSKLKEEADPSLPFLSLDVESLFTNVPIEPLLDFLKRKYSQGTFTIPEDYTIDGLISLIRVCVKATVFSFNGKFYRQLQGVSMGSPLAPVLACLWMEYFESELRQTIGTKQPSIWFRYVDDILIQWKHSIEEFTIFLNKLNNLNNLTKLTDEWETLDPVHTNSASIPFLDILIKRSPVGLSFSIYRKPTATDLYTHFYSFHLLHTKEGVVMNLFLRALKLCSKEYLDAEISHIHNDFLNLRYHVCAYGGQPWAFL